MLDKDATIISIVAGVFGYMTKRYLDVSAGKPFVLWKFLSELIISAGLGYFSYWASIDLGYSDGVSASIAGIVGHLGRDFFKLGRQIIFGRAQELAGTKKKGEHDDSTGY